MTGDADASLTTAQLAQRTGVPAGTLRMWEARHQFPVPVRHPGGHHRYTERDVESVQEVVRLRQEGLTMTAAIMRALAAAGEPPHSIFGALRRQRPNLQPQIVSKASLLQLTRAIEDEHCARGGTGLLIGSFQRERHYRESERRWRELARTVAIAVAVADFETLREPAGAPAEVPIARDHQLAREWALIVNSAGAKACLAAWELPSPRKVPELARRFEVTWSFEPSAVHDATLAAAALLQGLAPSAAAQVSSRLGEPPAQSSPELRFAADLAGRAVAYLSARPDASPSRLR